MLLKASFIGYYQYFLFFKVSLIFNPFWVNDLNSFANHFKQDGKTA